MTVATDRPKRGTPEFDWWLKGARAEAELQRADRPKALLEVVEFVDALAQHRHDLSREQVVAYAFTVYTADLSVWARLRLLWRYRVFQGRWWGGGGNGG